MLSAQASPSFLYRVGSATRWMWLIPDGVRGRRSLRGHGGSSLRPHRQRRRPVGCGVVVQYHQPRRRWILMILHPRRWVLHPVPWRRRRQHVLVRVVVGWHRVLGRRNMAEGRRRWRCRLAKSHTEADRQRQAERRKSVASLCERHLIQLGPVCGWAAWVVSSSGPQSVVCMKRGHWVAWGWADRFWVCGAAGAFRGFPLAPHLTKPDPSASHTYLLARPAYCHGVRPLGSRRCGGAGAAPDTKSKPSAPSTVMMSSTGTFGSRTSSRKMSCSVRACCCC